MIVYLLNPLIALKKETNIPIVTGETIMDLDTIKEFVDKDCINFISIDLPWNGLIESKKLLNIVTLKITK